MEQTTTKTPIRSVARYCPRMNDIKYSLSCEWKDCNLVLESMDAYLDHIDMHLVDDLKISQTYFCSWKECDYASFPSESSFKRHVRFHAFHTKLKEIGQNVLNTLKKNQEAESSQKHQPVPMCNLDELTRNIIPELPLAFECAWSSCNHSTDNPELFYRHIKEHVTNYPTKLRDSQCKWNECEQIIKSKSRLIEHMRHHSQEKVVSCPVCGALFSSITRFIDHCSRSTEHGNLCFQCSHCNKKFATNNLLKEHTRKHINKIKCPVCDMTCTDKNELSKHILFKHTDHRPYKCESCEYASKTPYDLENHVRLKHTERIEYQCNECEFKTKDINNMKRHMLKFHMNNETSMNLRDGQHFSSSYMCHVCNKVYCQGSTLSRHLKKTHNFEWPSGHSRFRYKLEADGYYRLQTLRYESLELYQTLNKEKSTANSENIQLNSTYDQSNDRESNQEIEPVVNRLQNYEQIYFIEPQTKSFSLPDDLPNLQNSPNLHELENELNFQNFKTKDEKPIEIETMTTSPVTMYNPHEIQFDTFETNQEGDPNQSSFLQLETPTKITAQGLFMSRKTTSSNNLGKSEKLDFDLDNFLLGTNFS